MWSTARHVSNVLYQRLLRGPLQLTFGHLATKNALRAPPSCAAVLYSKVTNLPLPNAAEQVEKYF